MIYMWGFLKEQNLIVLFTNYKYYTFLDYYLKDSDFLDG